MKLQKETTRHGKWYDDACGAAFALELLGERWSLLIVRELLLGGRRFTDLRAGLPGISAKVLTERLESLEQAGIVQRRQLPPPVATQVYELTRWGYAAEEAILALGRWAAMSSEHDPTLPLSAASMMLSLKTMFHAERAGGVRLTAAMHIGQDRFVVQVAEGALRVERGEMDAPDFTFSVPHATPVAFAVYGKRSFDELAGLGFSATGDQDAVRRFIDLFDLPEKIS